MPSNYYTHICYYIFIHSAVCLTTGPKPLPNRALHTVRSRASSFNSEYPLLSIRSSSSFLRFLPRLPVTSIPPFIFPSITRYRRQFLRKMWPIQLAFRFLISCTILLCFLKRIEPSLYIPLMSPALPAPACTRTLRRGTVTYLLTYLLHGTESFLRS